MLENVGQKKNFIINVCPRHFGVYEFIDFKEIIRCVIVVEELKVVNLKEIKIAILNAKIKLLPCSRSQQFLRPAKNVGKFM